ncbi:MAG: cysteine-rich CWC family protein [Gammaproteobacteria bacterium]
MPKHENKICPRCGTLFECKLGSITVCQCRDIEMSELLEFLIQSRYDDCLCIQCLRKLKDEFTATRMKNTLSPSE